MRNQLLLVDTSWKLDEHTKAIGRRGVAAAREVLAGINRQAVEEAGRAALATAERFPAA